MLALWKNWCNSFCGICGFASNELASRIDDSKAKVLLTASCGFEPGRTVHYKPLVDEALKLASHKIEKPILFQRPDNKV